jgi:DNA polymerase-3 subunit epsilon
MKSERLIIFDVETTGTDKQRDQIIELCVQFGVHDGAESRVWRVRPSVAISPGAEAVHGITMADLAECEPFAAVADEIRAIFAQAEVLVGYNLRFDIDMLQAEYMRLRQPLIELADKLIVDPFRLWQQCEPRSLMDAHKRFVGGRFEAAHSANADVAATGRVLMGMLDAFGLSNDWNEVANVCEPERASWLGTTSHVQWNEAGVPVLAFGKHAGTALTELASGPNAGYLRWILNKDFPHHVGEICDKALALDADAFLDWARSTFPAPVARGPEMDDTTLHRSTSASTPPA